MKKRLKEVSTGSVFRDIEGIEYFNFEEDFIEKNIRCIPMIVRFKLDKAGIKLKLAEWSGFTINERVELATRRCDNEEETKQYNHYLAALIKERSGKEATALEVDPYPGWANISELPGLLQERLKEMDAHISIGQWMGLTNLQRFALLKLCRPGHESKNFPKALKEFGLL